MITIVKKYIKKITDAHKKKLVELLGHFKSDYVVILHGYDAIRQEHVLAHALFHDYNKAKEWFNIQNKNIFENWAHRKNYLETYPEFYRALVNSKVIQDIYYK